MHARATTHTGTAANTAQGGPCHRGGVPATTRRRQTKVLSFRGKTSTKQTTKSEAAHITATRASLRHLLPPPANHHHPPNRRTQLHTSPCFALFPASALSMRLFAVLCAQPPAPSATAQRGKRPRNGRNRRKELAVLPDVSRRRRRMLCSADTFDEGKSKDAGGRVRGGGEAVFFAPLLGRRALLWHVVRCGSRAHQTECSASTLEVVLFHLMRAFSTLRPPLRPPTCCAACGCISDNRHPCMQSMKPIEWLPPHPFLHR